MNTPSDIASWRAQQRRQLLAQRSGIDKAQRAAWSARINALLLAALELPANAVVAAYWPFKGEFDPRFAMRAWRDAGIRTALPVVVGKAMALQFRDWRPGMRTSPGIYGLPVPEDGAIVRPDVVLMPPVGFDAIGYRLGYGGGYYDRTLAALSPQPLKIGVAFALSRIETIRPQAHDIAMDFVVTEQGVWRAQPAGMAPWPGRLRIGN